jgi:hypothetical protein
VGTVDGSLDAIAAVIRQRLQAPTRGGATTLVFVDASSRRVYAPINDGLIASQQPPASIVGVYNVRATARQIREDLAAWKAA